jgi:hypothetical protein
MTEGSGPGLSIKLPKGPLRISPNEFYRTSLPRPSCSPEEETLAESIARLEADVAVPMEDLIAEAEARAVRDALSYTFSQGVQPNV